MKKILIADDEPSIIMALEYNFKKLNYEVFIARDGVEVLEILKIHIPDLIILDIMMPNLDGYETMKEINRREELKQTKVIFLSAKSKKKDIEFGKELGVDEYITKPFSLKKLTFQVNKILG